MRMSGLAVPCDRPRRWRWATTAAVLLPLVAFGCGNREKPEGEDADRATEGGETGQPTQARSWCKLTLDGNAYATEACYVRLLPKSGVEPAVQAHDVIQVDTSPSLDSPTRYPHLFLEAKVGGGDFETLEGRAAQARCFVRTAEEAPVGQPVAGEPVTLTITRVGKTFVGGEFEGQVRLTGSEAPVPIRGSFKAWAKVE